MKENTGIRGHIKMFLTDNNTGKKRLIWNDKNAIQSSYPTIIVDALQVTINYALDNGFPTNGNPPLNGRDGIAVKDVGGLWYGCLLTTPVVTAGAVLIVGSFTGTAIIIPDANSMLLGQNWNNAAPNDFDATGGGSPYGTFAKPGSFPGAPGITVLITETLTIEWTITHY